MSLWRCITQPNDSQHCEAGTQQFIKTWHQSDSDPLLMNSPIFGAWRPFAFCHSVMHCMKSCPKFTGCTQLVSHSCFVILPRWGNKFPTVAPVFCHVTHSWLYIPLFECTGPRKRAWALGWMNSLFTFRESYDSCNLLGDPVRIPNLGFSSFSFRLFCGLSNYHILLANLSASSWPVLQPRIRTLLMSPF